jgi:hypothetical protein
MAGVIEVEDVQGIRVTQAKTQDDVLAGPGKIGISAAAEVSGAVPANSI